MENFQYCEDHRNINSFQGDGHPGGEWSPGNPVITSHTKVQRSLSIKTLNSKFCISTTHLMVVVPLPAGPDHLETNQPLSCGDFDNF